MPFCGSSVTRPHKSLPVHWFHYQKIQLKPQKRRRTLWNWPRETKTTARTLSSARSLRAPHRMGAARASQDHSHLGAIVTMVETWIKSHIHSIRYRNEKYHWSMIDTILLSGQISKCQTPLPKMKMTLPKMKMRRILHKLCTRNCQEISCVAPGTCPSLEWLCPNLEWLCPNKTLYFRALFHLRFN